MDWGLLVRLVLFWLRNRYDPDMIRFRELKRVKEANEIETIAIEAALARGNTVVISRIWSGMRNPED